MSGENSALAMNNKDLVMVLWQVAFMMACMMRSKAITGNMINDPYTETGYEETNQY